MSAATINYDKKSVGELKDMLKASGMSQAGDKVPI